MKFLYKLIRLIRVLQLPGALKGFLTWKYFSISSFKINYLISIYEKNFKTIFDIGANQGQFTIASMNRFPEANIYAFEPISEVLLKFKNNISGNDRVRVYNCAVGDTCGEIIFYSNKYSHVSSALVINEKNTIPNYDQSATSRIKIKTIKMDDILDDISIISPVLLKLDVQGYEREVIRGARRLLQKVDYIIIETPFVKLYEDQPLFNEINTLLNEHNFKLVAPIDFYEGNNLQIIEIDFLYKKS
jgi:FkbM family methyltransferase